MRPGSRNCSNSSRSACRWAGVGQPEEIARAALFLASGESSFMTGSELFVDGGEGHG